MGASETEMRKNELWAAYRLPDQRLEAASLKLDETQVLMTQTVHGQQDDFAHATTGWHHGMIHQRGDNESPDRGTTLINQCAPSGTCGRPTVYNSRKKKKLKGHTTSHTQHLQTQAHSTTPLQAPAFMSSLYPSHRHPPRMNRTFRRVKPDHHSTAHDDMKTISTRQEPVTFRR